MPPMNSLRELATTVLICVFGIPLLAGAYVYVILATVGNAVGLVSDEKMKEIEEMM